jgi:hypothetical protein
LTDHKRPAVLATAALQDIISLWQATQAAVIRGDTAEADRLRKEAHDMLDSYLDFGVEAAQAVRAIID